MRVFSLVVTRNEADRYFEACLSHLSRFSQIFVYDDQSTDQTREIADRWGARIHLRGESVPQFIEDEGEFRNNSWKICQEAMEPNEDDWILINDADEFLVGGNVLHILRETKTTEITLRIPEIFSGSLDPSTNRYINPQIRVDHFWNQNAHPRLFRYREGLFFADRKMGCGTQPQQIKKSSAHETLSLLHLGYMDKRDRLDRFNRYKDLPGHSKQHINSIIEQPRLAKWEEEWPSVWRGADEKGGYFL
jgi:glycosyltransferase involved in cell wall biosynthesis